MNTFQHQVQMPRGVEWGINTAVDYLLHPALTFALVLISCLSSEGKSASVKLRNLNSWKTTASRICTHTSENSSTQGKIWQFLKMHLCVL